MSFCVNLFQDGLNISNYVASHLPFSYKNQRNMHCCVMTFWSLQQQKSLTMETEYVWRDFQYWSSTRHLAVG